MRSNMCSAWLISSLMALSCSATASSRPIESMCSDTRLTRLSAPKLSAAIISPTRRLYAELIAARWCSSIATQPCRSASYRLSGIIEAPAVVNAMATLPSARFERISASNRYGRRSRRSSSDMVCRYTHSDPSASVGSDP